jgi:hypothetical protein
MAASGRSGVRVMPPGPAQGPRGVGGLTSCCRCGYMALLRCPPLVEPGKHRVWFGSSHLVVDVQALAGTGFWDEGLGHGTYEGDGLAWFREGMTCRICVGPRLGFLLDASAV